MPVKSFANSKFTVLETLTSSLGSGNNTVNGVNSNSSCSAGGAGSNSSYGSQITGYLDFVTAPGNLPSDALISKVVCRANVSGNAQGDGNTANAGSSAQIYGVIQPGGAYNGGPDVVSINAVGDPPQNLSYNEELSWEINFSPSKTRAELIALFGSAGTFPTAGKWLVAVQGCNASTDLAGDSASANASLGSWEFVVTYTSSESYSWYIKPTIKIVNGLPIRIIASSDDIISVIDGEEVPEGYELYGTGIAYPDGPVYEWWSSIDFYLFYIYSPINPSSLSNPTTWVALGITPPTCTGCTEVALGELTILVADASGVYKFDPEAIHDSLYVRTGFSLFVDTEDVKIPNPFGKLGPVP